VIGKDTSLPGALSRVLARTDNQAKLSAAEADERHLFIQMNDHAAASGLRGIWALPRCPTDPRGVIDSLWIFALGRRRRTCIASCPGRISGRTT
jgi:hypothetical protein